MKPLEKAGAALAVLAPAAALIWYSAVIVDKVNNLHKRVEKIEATQEAQKEAQAEDRQINELVRQHEEHLDWLRYHHHDHIGGRGHVD